MQCSLIYIFGSIDSTPRTEHTVMFVDISTSDNTGIYKGTVSYCAGLKLLVNHVGNLVLSVHKKNCCAGLIMRILAW